jgi:flagellar export protein FliJ
MPPRKFHFGPQPALDKAIAIQHEKEEALIEARKELADEKEKLAAIERKIAELKQQIKEEFDKAMAEVRDPVAAASVEARRRYVDLLRDREAQQLRAKREQEKQIRLVEQKVEYRKHELAEAMNQVKALEKFKEKARQEFKQQRQKAEDKELDDIAIFKSIRKRSSNP